jgi:hypothetical protein
MTIFPRADEKDKKTAIGPKDNRRALGGEMLVRRAGEVSEKFPHGAIPFTLSAARRHFTQLGHAEGALARHKHVTGHQPRRCRKVMGIPGRQEAR